MAEWKLWSGKVPVFTTGEWYATRERANHLEEEAHGERLQHAARLVGHACMAGAMSISDFGAGDGGLLMLVGREWAVPAWGYDLQQSNVKAAVEERKVDVRYADITRDKVEYGECLVICETLEHLEDPHGLLRNAPSKYLIASVPDGETPESHYEYHTWGWDIDGFGEMLEGAGYAAVIVTARKGHLFGVGERP